MRNTAVECRHGGHAGASYADSLTLTLTPMGLSEGFVYTGSDNTEIDYTVIGKDGSETGALGTGTATATANSDGTIKIVLTGTSAASVISNNGTFVFKIPYTDLKIDTDSDGTADTDFATYYNLDDSGVRSFTTTASVWSINGLALNLSGDGIDTAAAGYGTVDATVTTGAITITKDSSITVTGLSGVDSADDSITFTGTANGDGTYALSLTKDLASSDDNLSGTIKVYIAATVGETSYNVEADETAEYSLTYLSYLAAPSGSQVVAATGGDTTATVYTTVLNLAAFDDVNGTSVSAANALSVGDTVATGTIGTTEVTAVAVSAVSAGDTEIPVKITYDGDAPTGKVTLTTADGVATSSVSATQTDIAHFATGLLYSEDFSDQSTTSWTTSVSGRFDPVILSEDDNYYLSVNQSNRNNNGATVTGSIFDSSTISAAGTSYVLSFDLKVSSSTNQTATEFSVGTLFDLKETGTSVTTWTLNSDSEKIVSLPDTNKGNSAYTITDVPWYTVTIKRSSAGAAVSIVAKTSGEAVTLSDGTTAVTDLDSIATASTGTIGAVKFVSSRYMANFAIDNIVLFITE